MKKKALILSDNTETLSEMQCSGGNHVEYIVCDLYKFDAHYDYKCDIIVLLQRNKNPETLKLLITYIESVNTRYEACAFLVHLTDEYSFTYLLANALNHFSFLNPESDPDSTPPIYPFPSLYTGYFRFQTPLFAEQMTTFISHFTPEPHQTFFGLWELLINSIEHGNLRITHDEKKRLLSLGFDALYTHSHALLKQDPYQKYFVRCTFTQDQEGLNLDIKDDGDGFDWNQYTNIHMNELDAKSGRGIALARLSCFSELHYLGSGNHVRAHIPYPK
jgi:hypothetical protein